MDKTSRPNKGFTLYVRAKYIKINRTKLVHSKAPTQRAVLHMTYINVYTAWHVCVTLCFLVPHSK